MILNVECQALVLAKTAFWRWRLLAAEGRLRVLSSGCILFHLPPLRLHGKGVPPLFAAVAALRNLQTVFLKILKEILTEISNLIF